MAARYNHAYDDSGASAATDVYDNPYQITSSKDSHQYEIPNQTRTVIKVSSESKIPPNTVQNSPPKNSSNMCRLFLIIFASFVIGCVVGGGFIYLLIRQTQDASMEVAKKTCGYKSQATTALQYNPNDSAKNVDEVTLASICTCPTVPSTSPLSFACPTCPTLQAMSPLSCTCPTCPTLQAMSPLSCTCPTCPTLQAMSPLSCTCPTCPTLPASSPLSCTCPTPDTATCNFPVCANDGTCEDPDKCSCTACYEGLRCESGISGPLGIQIGSIDMIGDRQMTASSEYRAYGDDEYHAYEGRLHNSRFWASSVAQASPWLQVDFLKPVVITGILTQGAGQIAQWPKSIQVKYGKKSYALQTIMENGLPKQFTANVNKDDVKRIDFPGNYVARYVRVIVITYNYHPAMRVEVLGYKCG